MKKRIISILLSIIMIVSMIPFTAIPAFAQPLITVGYTDETGKLQSKNSEVITGIKLSAEKEVTDVASSDEPANPVISQFTSIISFIKDLIQIIKATISFINAGMPGLLPFNFK